MHGPSNSVPSSSLNSSLNSHNEYPMQSTKQNSSSESHLNTESSGNLDLNLNSQYDSGPSNQNTSTSDPSGQNITTLRRSDKIKFPSTRVNNHECYVMSFSNDICEPTCFTQANKALVLETCNERGDVGNL